MCLLGQACFMRKEILISKMLKCRASHADFVIPYQKYVKSIMNPICIGTRFKMRFEMDDSPERRYCKNLLHSMTIIIFLLVMIYSQTVMPFLLSWRCNGVVTGITDLDPYRWPNSKWRCLMVSFKILFSISDIQYSNSLWFGQSCILLSVVHLHFCSLSWIRGNCFLVELPFVYLVDHYCNILVLPFYLSCIITNKYVHINYSGKTSEFS